MTDLHRALSEIHLIRGQIARTAEFRGYGTATLAVTGVLALIAAGLQAVLFSDPAYGVRTYLAIWVATAAVSLIIIIIEALVRAQRVHSGLAMEMVHCALEQFMPAIVAGLLVTVVLFKAAPASLWMLPGLWQVIFSLGIFSSCRFLPRLMYAAGGWYLLSGMASIAVGEGRALSAWTMGIGFGAGQLLVAAVLWAGTPEAADEN